MAESPLEQATRTYEGGPPRAVESTLDLTSSNRTQTRGGYITRRRDRFETMLYFSTRRTPTRYLRGRSILGSGIHPRLKLLQIEPRLEEATSLDVGIVLRQCHVFQLGVRRLTTYEEGPFWAVESTLDLDFFKSNPDSRRLHHSTSGTFLDKVIFFNSAYADSLPTRKVHSGQWNPPST